MAVLSLPDAKAYLNITTTESDTDLTAIIASAEAAIARRVGPLEAAARTERVYPNETALVLLPPAASLTSVVDDSGSALTVGDLYLNSESGVVTRNDGGAFSARYYTVVYQYGRATCPEDLVLAVKEMVRHLWVTSRGVPSRAKSAMSEATANTIPGAAYILPFRVSELIAPHMQPGFA